MIDSCMKALMVVVVRIYYCRPNKETVKHFKQRNQISKHTNELTNMVNVGVVLVNTLMQELMEARTPQQTMAGLSPQRCVAQAMGMNHNTNMMVPQLVNMATVEGPQPSKATFMDSAMGPHVLHSTLCKGNKLFRYCTW